MSDTKYMDGGIDRVGVTERGEKRRKGKESRVREGGMGKNGGTEAE